MAKPAICLVLMLFEEQAAVTPMRTTYRLGSTMEFGATTVAKPHG